ncbi:MAG: hypothetical protein VB102_10185 [Paludibacter sp.]|nr:hypothetical protein [Paludibacter sp.]
MAKTHNANAEGKILHSKDILSRTKLNASGDLNLSINVDGQSQYPSVDYDGFGDTYNQLFRGLRPEYWTVEINPYIYNYRSYVQTMYYINKIRR